MPRDVMSEQQINIGFVKEVKKHPTLYNFELATYARKDVTDQAWEEVGKATNMTPSACRERWRNLRAVFMRTMRAKPPRTGKKKPYYLAEAMQFVIPYMRPIVTAEAAKEKQKLQANEALQALQTETDNQITIEVQNIKVENEEYTDDMNTQENDHTKKRPARGDELRQTKKAATLPQSSTSFVVPPTSDVEHVKSFLNSLVPELTEMNSAQFKNFKRRVLLLIDDITGDVPASPRHTEDSDSEYIM